MTEWSYASLYWNHHTSNYFKVWLWWCENCKKLTGSLLICLQEYMTRTQKLSLLVILISVSKRQFDPNGLKWNSNFVYSHDLSKCYWLKFQSNFTVSHLLYLCKSLGTTPWPQNHDCMFYSLIMHMSCQTCQYHIV